MKRVHRGSLFLKVQARKDIIPSVWGRRPTQAPGHSLSPWPSGAGAPGPAQTSRSARPSRTPGTPAVAHTPTARALGHRDHPEDDPGATPDATVGTGAGPPHGHSPGSCCSHTLLPLPRPHSRPVPAGGPGWRCFPARPPFGCALRGARIR